MKNLNTMKFVSNAIEELVKYKAAIAGSKTFDEAKSTGTAPPVLMMAGQQRQHERFRLWFQVLGINPHVKDMTARKLLVRNLAVLLLKKGCATNECRKETSGTAREQNPKRNFQGTWNYQIFLRYV